MNESQGVLFSATGFIFASLIPELYFNTQGKPRVEPKDINTTAAERRFREFLVAGFSEILGTLIMKAMGAPDSVVLVLLAPGVNAFIGGFVNLSGYKLSAHAHISSSRVTAVILAQPRAFWAATGVFVLIALNRIYLSAHSWDQLVSGTALGVCGTLFSANLVLPLIPVA